MNGKPFTILVVFISVLYGSVLLPFYNYSQERPEEKRLIAAMPAIDKLMRDYAAKNHFPGFTYGIVFNGKLIHTGQTGFTNPYKKTPVTTGSAFRVASMSKSFTAMAILQLRDRGQLNLDDQAAKYIPELENLKYPGDDSPAITIRHLLTHAAGFPEDNAWGDRQLAVRDTSFIRLIKEGLSFSNVPGISYEYSNLGFAMLGYIIQQVTGINYGKYITDSILKPLGMNNTWYEYDDVPADQLVPGYRWVGNKWVLQPMLHDGIYGAMGGMISTIEDFSRYVALHLDVWPPGPENDGPLKNSSIREMQHPWNIPTLDLQYKYPNNRHCPIISSYGYGLRWAKDCDERVTISHSGGLPGFGSNWTIFPDYDIGIISFSNLTYANAGFFNLLVLDSLISVADLQPPMIIPSGILKKRQEQLTALLPDFKGAASAGIFAENFFLDYVPAELANEAKAIFKKAGKIKHVSEMIPENHLRGYYLLTGETAVVRVYFTLTPEKNPLIQQYRIEIVK